MSVTKVPVAGRTLTAAGRRNNRTAASSPFSVATGKIKGYILPARNLVLSRVLALQQGNAMLTHPQIWAAIDALAASHGMSPSGLARRAGLDATTFNKSKRSSSGGR